MKPIQSSPPKLALQVFAAIKFLLAVISLNQFSVSNAVAQFVQDSNDLRMVKNWAVPISPEALSSGVVQCQGSRWIYNGAWNKSQVVVNWDATSLETVHPDGTATKCDVRIELAHTSVDGDWSIVRSVAQTDYKNGVTTANVMASSERGFPTDFTVTISLINDQGEFLGRGSKTLKIG